MNDETQINPINNNAATEINDNINSINITSINQTATQGEIFAVGNILCGKYEVVSKLDVVTGEADLYICHCDNKSYVAKIYRRKVAIKQEVTEILKQIDSPFISKVFETGTVDGMPFEILPYYKNGSIQGKKFTLKKLKNHIIPSINEGLKVLHDKQIIHKDLKPSNIMLLDKGQDVAIIDFGISSVREAGNTVIVTKTGMTPEYSAPETFKNLFLKESDYYSFGVTVCELYCGHSPYANMKEEEIEQYVSIQKLPIPKNMPKELADFINALTYYDITNRKNKNNPNRRWTYDEVKNWCDGKTQIIPGESVSNSVSVAMPEYTFKDNKYSDMLSFVIALAQNWESGKKELFRGIMSGFFKAYNPQITGYCLDAEEESNKTSGKEDIIFLKTIYRLSPEIKDFYWKGKTFESLPALGREMLEKLWNNDKSDYDYYDSILKEKVLSEYIGLVFPNNQDLKKAADGIETIQIVESKIKREKLYYMVAYMLSGQKVFNFEGMKFKTLDEFTEYMKKLLDESYETFQTFCHKILDFNDNLNAQFECWIIVLGKRNELEQWQKSLKI